MSHHNLNSSSHEPSTLKKSGLPTIDINEYGGKRNDERQSMNRRLFMQLLVFQNSVNTNPDQVASHLAEELKHAHIASIVYADVNHPRNVGLLTWSENPTHFVEHVRPLFARSPLSYVNLLENFTMMGRSYSSGYEPDLEYTLLRRPVENVMNPEHAWHVWYPLRRIGAFSKLEAQEQTSIMREHAQIGLAYGQQGLAHDVRLSCYGLDMYDNEFVIGLVGRELHPLSHLVQTMRKTRQTSEFIEKMGPFFVGYVLHRNCVP